MYICTTIQTVSLEFDSFSLGKNETDARVAITGKSFTFKFEFYIFSLGK